MMSMTEDLTICNLRIFFKKKNYLIHDLFSRKNKGNLILTFVNLFILNEKKISLKQLDNYLEKQLLGDIIKNGYLSVILKKFINIAILQNIWEWLVKV